METTEQQRVDRARLATRIARHRATLGVIDQAHLFGVILAQEDAARLVDRAVGEYVATLGAVLGPEAPGGAQ